MTEIERIVNRMTSLMPTDNTCVFDLAAFRECLQDMLEVNLASYIKNAAYASDTKAQGARSLSPDKYDILCDLCDEIIDRKQGIYKEPVNPFANDIVVGASEV